MRPRPRPDVRPAPWKILGWVEAPGALPVREVGPVAGEPQPDTLRSYHVGVAEVKGRLVAYTSTAVVEGGLLCCLHRVSAADADGARKAALAEHRERCPAL